jgi:hypothetical protein
VADEVSFERDGRTYRVRGLQAKAQSIATGSSELDSMLGDRVAAARTALAEWRGRHSVTFAEEANVVLGKIAALRVALLQASNTLANFPGSGSSWGSARYQDEVYMGARVDVPVEPGTASANTANLRSYFTTAAGQDERFASLAALVNLEGSPPWGPTRARSTTPSASWRSTPGRTRPSSTGSRPRRPTRSTRTRSVVVAEAARGGQLDAENYIFMASPGVNADHVNDLGIPPDRVYASRAPGDPIRTVPWFVHGPEPIEPGFGARTFESSNGGGDDPHSSYWDEGNPARRNIADIVTGNANRDAALRPAPPPPPPPTPVPVPSLPR